MPADPMRYVVLRHDGIPEPHFDFLIEPETGRELPAWRAPFWPPRGGEIFERLPDHRSAYLDFEGPVSGNRGHVRRVEAGVCAARLTDETLHVRFPAGTELSLVRDAPPHWRCAVNGAPPAP
jgi:hypothetical protein